MRDCRRSQDIVSVGSDEYPSDTLPYAKSDKCRFLSPCHAVNRGNASVVTKALVNRGLGELLNSGLSI